MDHAWRYMTPERASPDASVRFHSSLVIVSMRSKRIQSPLSTTSLMASTACSENCPTRSRPRTGIAAPKYSASPSLHQTGSPVPSRW